MLSSWNGISADWAACPFEAAMATNFEHRLTTIVPAAKVSAVVAWFAVNVSANAVPADLGPPLNATGLLADAVTFRWCCGSWIDADAKKIMVKLCQLAGVTVPTASQWDNATNAQKRAWAASVRAGILSGYGAGVWLADNTDQWDDPQTVLAVLGLKTIQAGV